MRGMKVNIATNHLLEVVKRNRETYAKILEEAKIEWRKKVIAAMEVNLEDAQAGGPVRTGIALPPPPDHLEEYDQAIAMLELSEDAQMELTSDQFDALVRNKWDWMGSAKVSMLSYCASAASLPD